MIIGKTMVKQQNVFGISEHGFTQENKLSDTY